LYFENSLRPPDLELLPAAGSAVTRIERIGPKTVIESTGVGLAWKGPAMVDGQVWPAADDDTVWIPPGSHSVEPAAASPKLRLLRLSGDLKAARVTNTAAIEFSYQSEARAIAVLDRVVSRVEIDGIEVVPRTAGRATLLLPRGQHVVSVSAP